MTFGLGVSLPRLGDEPLELLMLSRAAYIVAGGHH
jgi:hypothetical protein